MDLFLSIIGMWHCDVIFVYISSNTHPPFPIFTTRIHSVWEGNVFTHVCLSVCSTLEGSHVTFPECIGAAVYIMSCSKPDHQLVSGQQRGKISRMMGRSHGTPLPPRSGHGSGPGYPLLPPRSGHGSSHGSGPRYPPLPPRSGHGSGPGYPPPEVVIMEVVIMEVDQGTPPPGQTTHLASAIRYTSTGKWVVFLEKRISTCLGTSFLLNFDMLCREIFSSNTVKLLDLSEFFYWDISKAEWQILVTC